jgi:hypothetical protein
MAITTQFAGEQLQQILDKIAPSTVLNTAYIDPFMARKFLAGSRAIREYNDLDDGGCQGLTAGSVSELSTVFNAYFQRYNFVGTAAGTTTITIANTTQLAIGDVISGTGVTAGTTITSIVANTSIVVSVLVTAGTNITFNGKGWRKDRANASDHCWMERLNESYETELWTSDGTTAATPVSWIKQVWTGRTGDTTFSGGYLFGLGNKQVRPLANNGAAIAWNFTGGGGEVDFWNTYTGIVPTIAYSWKQLTGTGVTHTDLMSLSGTGSLVATSINNTPIGSTTPNTGAFTTLSATGTITQNFSGLTAVKTPTGGALVREFADIAPAVYSVSVNQVAVGTGLTFTTTAGIFIGMLVTGVGIATNTTVVAVTATTVTLSLATTAMVTTITGAITFTLAIGSIEIGTTYNWNPLATTTTVRDITDICWVEKWNDTGGLKEFWYAASGANTVAPVWVQVSQLDTVNGMYSTPAFSGQYRITTGIAGAQGTGSIQHNASQGVVIWPKTGTVNDFSIVNAANSLYVMYVPTGTNNVTFPGSVNSAGGVYTTGPLVSASAATTSGYTTGAGGTVTQLTSRTTGVTLSKPCGSIVLFSAAATANVATSFVVTNTLVTATDNIVLTQGTAGALGGLYNLLAIPAAGSFTVWIIPVNTVVAETLTINFAILKTVTA